MITGARWLCKPQVGVRFPMPPPVLFAVLLSGSCLADPFDSNMCMDVSDKKTCEIVAYNKAEICHKAFSVAFKNTGDPGAKYYMDICGKYLQTHSYPLKKHYAVPFQYERSFVK